MKKFVITIIIIIVAWLVISNIDGDKTSENNVGNIFNGNTDSFGNGSVNLNHAGEYNLVKVAIDDENVLGINKEILTLYPDGTGNLYFVGEMMGTSTDSVLWEDGKIKFTELGLVWDYQVDGNQMVASGKWRSTKKETMYFEKTKRVDTRFAGHYVLEKFIVEGEDHKASKTEKEKNYIDFYTDGTGRHVYQSANETFDGDIFWNDKEIIYKDNKNRILPYKLEENQIIINVKMSEGTVGAVSSMVFKRQ